MCGIVGVLSVNRNGFSMEESNVFRDMLVIDSFRGMDSTGVFGVNSKANVRIVKEASHGMDFILSQAYDDFDKELKKYGLFAVGHNRAATKGAISDKNAHPFFVDDKIVLVQNGTVRGDHTKLGKNTKELEVDSEAVAHVIAENEDIEKALQSIDSAYALAWFNTQTEKLHLIRNIERPMWISKHKHRNGLLFCSEAHTILYVLSKYNMKDYETPKMLDPGQLMTFEIKGDHFTENTKKIDHLYRHTTTGTGNRRFPRHGFWAEDPDEGELLARAYGITDPVTVVPFTPRSTLALPQPRSQHAKNDIKLQFGDYAATDLRDYHVASADVSSELARIEKEIGNEIFIELDGFIEANPDPECQAWHVWGSIVSSKDDWPTKVLAHWMVYNYTKAQMKEYSKHTYFEAVRNTIIANRFRTPSGEERSFLKTYVHSVKPFINTPETSDATSQASVH